MTIQLMSNLSEIERVDKTVNTLSTITGHLKDGTSVIDPVIILQGTPASVQQIVSCNYMYIEDFGRYYFVNEITSIRNNLWEVSGHVDVLMTYSEQIRQQTAIIQRQEINWNLYLNDGSFKVYQNPMVLTKPFPAGFNTQQFVLAVAGS